jgi:TusE/DsrC/DsvC family sulfur relay protein
LALFLGRHKLQSDNKKGGASVHALANFTDLETVARDPEGYLLDPNDWTPRLASQLAAEEGLELTDERWYLIIYIRDYFDEHMSIPEARMLLRHLGREWVSDRAARRYLDRLFLKGYSRQACKIAGMAGSRRAEDRGQKTEDRRQRTEDRRRKAEDGRQKTEGRAPG